MKKMYWLMMVLLTVMTTSCGNNSKEIELKEQTVAYDSTIEYARGAELLSLVPGTAVLEWGEYEAQPGTTQIRLTATVRLDKQLDTALYYDNITGDLPEFNINDYTLLLMDTDGLYAAWDGEFSSDIENHLSLFPGFSSQDSETELAKLKALLQSKPGETAEVTFTGYILDAYLENVENHVASAVLCSMHLVRETKDRRF